MTDIDPNSEFMIALDDAWDKHWAFNYNKMPNRKLFYKFVKFLRYDSDDDAILKNIDSIIEDNFADFQNYLIGH